MVKADAPNPARAWLAPCAVALGALGIAAYAHFEAFFDPYLIAGDARAHIYWMARFSDPELFRGDFLTDYVIGWLPPGYVWLYSSLAPAIDPLLLSKLIPVLLASLSSLLLFLLLRDTAGPLAGWLGAALFAVTPIFLAKLSGGFPRSFAVPLIIAFLYLCSRRAEVAKAWLLLVQALLFPPTFLICSISSAFGLIGWSRGRPSLNVSSRRLIPFVIAFSIAGSMLGYRHLIHQDPAVGPVSTRDVMEGHAEFYAGGRYALLPTPSLVSVVKRQAEVSIGPLKIPGRTSKWGELPELLLTCGSVLALLFWSRRSSSPIGALGIELLRLFLASVVLFWLADVFLMRLYMPFKFLRYSCRVIFLIATAIALAKTIEFIALPRLRHAVFALTLGLVLLHADAPKGVGIHDMSADRHLHEFLAGVPKQALVAAHPIPSDDIPMYAKRAVFLSHELSLPWYTIYWQTIRERSESFFRAYYARDLVDVDAFLTRYQIDYLVVDRRDFSRQRLSLEEPYMEPFNPLIRSLTKDSGPFAVMHIPAASMSYDDGVYFVVERSVLAQHIGLAASIR